MSGLQRWLIIILYTNSQNWKLKQETFISLLLLSTLVNFSFKLQTSHIGIFLPVMLCIFYWAVNSCEIRELATWPLYDFVLAPSILCTAKGLCTEHLLVSHIACVLVVSYVYLLMIFLIHFDSSQSGDYWSDIHHSFRTQIEI